MQNITFALLIISAITAAAFLTAGCVQGTGSGAQDSAQSATPVVAGQGNSPAGAPPGAASQVRGSSGSPGQVYRPDGQGAGTFANGTPRRGNGQGFSMNATRIADAAGKLGVTPQQLTDALSIVNSTTGRSNRFTDAAQKLGVTEQQLRDAFGFPAGGFQRQGPVAQQTTGNS